jgi:hypothetical protein
MAKMVSIAEVGPHLAENMPLLQKCDCLSTHICRNVTVSLCLLVSIYRLLVLESFSQVLFSFFLGARVGDTS